MLGYAFATGGAQVILVVLPVTADFATQEALRIASELDPSGSRTIGVFTKIDIDPSSLVKQMTEAQADGFCSKLGYVAVGFSDHAVVNFLCMQMSQGSQGHDLS